MQNRKGFTLVELMIVVAIIGILAMVAIPAYIGQQTRATRTEGFTNLENIRLLEEQFFADNAAYAALGALTGFNPGPDIRFTYAISSLAVGVGLPNPAPVPYDGTTAALADATRPCFIATATGNAGSRVDGDVFAIDCMNNRNF
jgi:prepilin-type N-terminal cleavage/methylation domain-containing protein